MSFIPDLSDIPELSPVAPGEYDLRIIQAKETKSNRTGRTGIMMICEIVGEDNAQNLIETMWLPMDSDDEVKKTKMYRMIKDRLEAIGLPTTGTNVTDFAGAEFSAILDLETSDEYGDSNKIKKIL
jgi:hypothetical protein